MSSDNPPNASVPPAPSADGADRSEPPPDAADPYATWVAALETWCRQNPEVSGEFQRALRTALDQARSLSRMARGLAPGESQSARAPQDFGIWQPVMTALEQCQAKLIPETADADAASGYARARAAYFAEFECLNAELLPQLTRRLAQRNADLGFIELHRIALEEAERAYLERASSNEFAERQAKFINEMLRLVKQLRSAQSAADGGPRT